MRRHASYRIEEDTADKLVIRDLGPWDQHPTVTNDAEGVVYELGSQLRGRRLFYYDSENNLDEILVKEGRFAGFAPGPKGDR